MCHVLDCVVVQEHTVSLGELAAFCCIPEFKDSECISGGKKWKFQNESEILGFIRIHRDSLVMKELQ